MTGTRHFGMLHGVFASEPSGGRRDPWVPGAGTMRVFVLVMVVAIAALFASEEQRRLDDPVQQGRRGEIAPAGPQSFLRATRLQEAVDAIVRAAPGRTFASLRITPTQVVATVRQSDGRQEMLALDPALQIRRYPAGSAAGSGLKPSQIPVAVPNRLFSLAVDRLELQPEHLDYVLLMVSSSPGQRPVARWGLYYSEPPLENDAIAALDGTDLRRMGQPDAAARASLRKSHRAAAKARTGADRRITAARKREKRASR